MLRRAVTAVLYGIANVCCLVAERFQEPPLDDILAARWDGRTLDRDVYNDPALRAAHRCHPSRALCDWPGHHDD